MNVQKISRFFSLAVLFLIFMHVSTQLFFHYNKTPLQFEFINALFNLDSERSIATYFSATTLLASGLLSFLLRKTSRFYLYFAVLLSLMAVDEAVSIHEGISGIVEYYRTGIPINNFFTIGWVIVGLPLVLGIFIWFNSVRKKYRVNKKALLGLAVFFAGALVIEGLTTVIKPQYLHYSLGAIVAEEGLELAGAVLILRYCLQEAKQQNLIVRFI